MILTKRIHPHRRNNIFESCTDKHTRFNRAFAQNQVIELSYCLNIEKGRIAIKPMMVIDV